MTPLRVPAWEGDRLDAMPPAALQHAFEAAPHAPACPRVPWTRAVFTAIAAVYGPGIGMALYALLFVACTHCKLSAWVVVPCGPALLPLEIVRQAVRVGAPGAALTFAAALGASLGMVAALAVMLRRSWWLGLAAACVAAVALSFVAVGTLAAIQA